MTINKLYGKLRAYNLKNYTTLFFCIILSVVLVTSYALIYFSPTVQNILPTGGDSRKQAMMIFSVAILGCSVFTTYASSLFLKFKSKEIGIFMALGADRKKLKKLLFSEILLISIIYCVLGLILSIPVSFGIWKIFQLVIIDTREMTYQFGTQGFIYGFIFCIFVTLCIFMLSVKFINRTNIIDILNDQRISEPIHDVKEWYGILGMAFIILDAIMNFRKKSKLVIFFTLIITILFTVGATAIGAYTVPQIPTNVGTQKINNKSADNTQKLDISSSGKLPDNIQNLDMSFDIYNGGVEILPSSSNEIEASYDGEYYDVHITKENGKWIVRISGKVSLMGKTDFVKLYVPNVKRVMNVKVRNGDFSYDLPNNCTDVININAANAGIQFTSKNKYDNSKISLTATDKNFLIYDLLVYPNYFTKTDTGFKYRKGTEATQIGISLTGYTDVEFK